MISPAIPFKACQLQLRALGIDHQLPSAVVDKEGGADFVDDLPGALSKDANHHPVVQAVSLTQRRNQRIRTNSLAANFQGPYSSRPRCAPPNVKDETFSLKQAEAPVKQVRAYHDAQGRPK